MTIDPHWEYAAKAMLEALDGNPADQHWVLHGEPASIRAALKNKGGNAGMFENMGDREFYMVVSTARVIVERVARAYRRGAA